MPLKGDSDRQADYKSLATATCPSDYYDKVTAATLKVSEDNQNIVSSSFLSNIYDQVKMTSGNAADLPLAFSNYQALNSDVLLAIARQATNTTGERQLPASSSLIFEVWRDGSVHGYINDEEVVPVGCEADAPCTSDLFLEGL